MKKGVVYFFTCIGVLAVLYFIISSFLSVSGQTMYGTAGGPIPTIASIPDAGSSDSAPGSPAGMQTGDKIPTDGEIKGMIIHNANISLQVDNISATLDKITQLANNSGGYVVSSNLNQNSLSSGANISIRVPAQGLNNVLTTLKSFATQVMQESISGEDITQRFISLESRLKNLQATKDQLTKIMAGATKTADVLAVYQELSETQGQMEVVEGQIKYYKQSVAYSLINIDLNINPKLTTIEQKQWRVLEVAKKSYHDLIDQLRNTTYGLIEFVVYFLPLLLLWGLIFLILFWIGKKIWSKF
jgi:hypothetical protein